MRSFVAAALTLTGAAFAAPGSEAASAKFQLRVLNNDAIFGWALVNAHVAAGTNVIQIQRPAAYQPDVSHLDNGTLSFDLKGATIPYGLRVPVVPKGGISLVTSQPGTGTKGFAINANNYLTYNGNVEGWWACPVNDTFELFYGVNPDPANIPSAECQSFELGAGFI
ncbi:hypothetical protein E0Z10_g1992 [Xylaria hypoxylon]|uniref:DUF7907 domain-containing protein n=1 Tax=Xylaria hypoxylon TaxID=37992 RepID=A0A4Z0YS55_9PEZI|nr:hypothetical protein E0Z10_g1992 [Xylaria hypoxylon]